MAKKSPRERTIRRLEKILDLQKRICSLNDEVVELSYWIEHSDDKFLSEDVNPKFYNSRYSIGRDITETDVKLFNRTLRFIKEYIDAIKERHKEKCEELEELTSENDMLCELVGLDPEYRFQPAIFALTRLLKKEKAETLEEAIELFDENPNWVELL